MRFQDIPIQRKLMLAIVATTGSVLILACATLLSYEVITIHRNMVQSLTSRADIVAANCSAALAFQNPDDATEVLAALVKDPHMVSACIYDNDGRLFAKYPAHTPDDSFPSRPMRPGYFYEPFDLVVIAPVVHDSRILGTVYLKSDLKSLTNRYHAYVGLTFLILVGSVFLGFLISRSLQRQIARPILVLAESARAVSERRDYSVRAPKMGDDELGLLTDAFNHMLTQIQEQTLVLSESETRLRAVLDSALSAVVVVDSESRVTDWNSRAESMFGWTRREVLGRKMAEIIIPERYREAHQRGMKHYLATGEGPVLNRPIELTALCRDGSEFPVELSISPMKAGETVSFCGFITDITERKQMEETRQRLAAIVQSSDDAIISKTLDGVITSWNHGAEKLFGYSGLEALGKPITMLFPPELQDSEAEILAQLAGGNKIDHFETVRVRKDGSRVDVSVAISPITDASGRVIGASKIARDITERKQAEAEINKLNQELEQRVRDRTSQLEAANKELEAFSYSVSHDLRAPLRHVDGFVDLLRRDANEKLGDSGRRYLDIISDSAKRMGLLIDDLLVFSRMGRMEMRHSTVKTGDLVKQVLEEMAPDLQGRNIVWDIGPLPDVYGDLAMLKQVWVNLISNAVKYSRKRECTEITIRGSKNERHEFEFSIRDNGAGFDMQYADKLFGVFQRLHHAEEFEGTGIGLANVRRIILRHGGSIWAEGMVDKGATFHFTIPESKKNVA